MFSETRKGVQTAGGDLEEAARRSVTSMLPQRPTWRTARSLTPTENGALVVETDSIICGNEPPGSRGIKFPRGQIRSDPREEAALPRRGRRTGKMGCKLHSQTPSARITSGASVLPMASRSRSLWWSLLWRKESWWPGRSAVTVHLNSRCLPVASLIRAAIGISLKRAIAANPVLHRMAAASRPRGEGATE